MNNEKLNELRKNLDDALVRYIEEQDDHSEQRAKLVKENKELEYALSAVVYHYEIILRILHEQTHLTDAGYERDPNLDYCSIMACYQGRSNILMARELLKKFEERNNIGE